MAKGPFFFFLLFLCNAAGTSSDIPLPHAKEFEVVWEKKQLFQSIHRVLMDYFHSRTTEHDSIDPPTTALNPPSIPNPVTSPPINSAPGIVTVPGTNPAIPPPVTNPAIPPPVANPANPPPVTNPANPSPVTNPVNPPPATNPVNANPVNTPVANPVNPPVPVTNPPGSGRWCIAKNGASQAALQSALDYACGIGGADCVSIQQGSSCYEPATLQNHASYAFNSYYQKNPAPTSCVFGGAAAVTTTNPSTGSCVYPSSSSSSSPPLTTQAPVNPTSLPTAPPTTSSAGQGTQYPPPPPPAFSLGNPDPTGLGAYGASPPLMNTASVSTNLRPSIATAASIVMFGLAQELISFFTQHKGFTF